MIPTGLRVLVVGAGAISTRVHIPYLLRHFSSFAIAVYDIDPQAALRAGRTFGVATTDRSISDTAADIAVICAPPRTHGRLVVEALDAGMHVICEKPLADSAADVALIAEASIRSRRQVFACYTNRYREDVRTLAALMATGRLGHHTHVAAQWVRHRGVPGTHGARESGVLWDLGSHLIDLGVLLTGWQGEAVVSASLDRLAPNGTETSASAGWYGTPSAFEPASMAVPHDTFTGTAHFGDATLEVLASWDYPCSRDEVILRVSGSLGVAELRTVFGFSPDRQTIPAPSLQVRGIDDLRWFPVISSQSREPVEYTHQLDLAMRTFFQRDRPETTRPTGLDLAVRSVALGDAFARSASFSKEISVHLPERAES